MTESQLIDAWRAYLNAPAHGMHLVNHAHVLQVFVGRTEQGAPRMVIRSEAKPAMPALSSLVLVERYQDGAGKWNLSFTLQDAKFTEVFLRLADDVHGRSARAPNEAVALDKVSTVISEWWRLLKPRPTGLLTMEELRGLIGELWLLLGEFSAPRAMDVAVEGWLGPLGLPQDFWYPDTGYHEAKSIGPSTTTVRINSETQLDESPLELMVLRVANTGETSVGAVNLPTLVARVGASLAEIGASTDPLNERLMRLGVNVDEPFYRDTWFVVTHLLTYGVRPEFPAIRASQLDPAIGRVTYQVELALIERFLTRTVEVG